MHDNPGPGDSYPIGWQIDLDATDYDPVAQHDAEFHPSYGTAFQDYWATAALRSRLADAAAKFFDGDPEGALDALDIANDATEEFLHGDADAYRAIGKLLFGAFELFQSHLVGAIGAELAVARLEGDADAHRQLALEQASW